MSTESEKPSVRLASTTAERMRNFRRRRRYRLRSVRISLGVVEIGALVAKGYLDTNNREDLSALGLAADAFISDALCDLC
jgi:hypothetical protein